MSTQGIHALADRVAEIILSETESHQLLMPTVEIELTEQLTAPADSPIFSGCTGERREHIRRMRETILELSICGVGAKAIARKLDISPQAVRAVRASAWQRGELDPLKQRLGREYLATADLLRAEALERIDEIPAHVLLLASAQAADKGQLLTGGATQRVERSTPVPADLNELIDALPCVAVPVEGVEGQESARQKGEELKALTCPDGVDTGNTTDSQSTGLPGVEAPCVSGCVSDGVEAPPS